MTGLHDRELFLARTKCFNKFTFRWALHFTDQFTVPGWVIYRRVTTSAVCRAKVHEYLEFNEPCSWKFHYLRDCDIKVLQWLLIPCNFLAEVIDDVARCGRKTIRRLNETDKHPSSSKLANGKVRGSKGERRVRDLEHVIRLKAFRWEISEVALRLLGREQCSRCFEKLKWFFRGKLWS